MAKKARAIRHIPKEKFAEAYAYPPYEGYQPEKAYTRPEMDDFARGILRTARVISEHRPDTIFVPERGAVPLIQATLTALRHMNVSAREYHPNIVYFPNTGELRIDHDVFASQLIKRAFLTKEDYQKKQDKGKALLEEFKRQKLAAGEELSEEIERPLQHQEITDEDYKTLRRMTGGSKMRHVMLIDEVSSGTAIHLNYAFLRSLLPKDTKLTVIGIADKNGTALVSKEQLSRNIDGYLMGRVTREAVGLQKRMGEAKEAIAQIRAEIEAIHQSTEKKKAELGEIPRKKLDEANGDIELVLAESDGMERVSIDKFRSKKRENDFMIEEKGRELTRRLADKADIDKERNDNMRKRNEMESLSNKFKRMVYADIENFVKIPVKRLISMDVAPLLGVTYFGIRSVPGKPFTLFDVDRHVGTSPHTLMPPEHVKPYTAFLHDVSQTVELLLKEEEEAKKKRPLRVLRKHHQFMDPPFNPS